MCLVSILMPVYNCDKYISEQLCSLFNQTYKNFEILVVDDGSTDSTMEIVKFFISIDSRIKAYKNEFSKGIAGSLNTAMKYASGVYFARADGDDIHLPERLMLQISFLESNPDIAIVGGRSKLFNDAGYIRETYYPCSSIELVWKFISNTYFCHPSVMFRAEVYNQIGGYSYEHSEDFAFFSKALKKFKGSNLPNLLLNYRVHNKSYSTISATAIEDSVYGIYRENYKYYIGSLKNLEEFYTFHSKKILKPALLFKVASTGVKILNRMRENYKMNLYHPHFLKILLRLFIDLFSAMYNYYKILFYSLLFEKSNGS